MIQSVFYSCLSFNDMHLPAPCFKTNILKEHEKKSDKKPGYEHASLKHISGCLIKLWLLEGEVQTLSISPRTAGRSPSFLAPGE